MPSSNHLIETSPAKLVFLILVGGCIQAMRARLLGPEPVRVGGGALGHGAIAGGIDMGARGDCGLHFDQGRRTSRSLIFCWAGRARSLQPGRLPHQERGQRPVGGSVHRRRLCLIRIYPQIVAAPEVVSGAALTAGAIRRQSEKQAMMDHRRLLPVILVTLSIRIKVTIRRR